jgi:hypothetical protein
MCGVDVDVNKTTRLMFQPTMAMAPMADFADNIVVAFVHSLGSSPVDWNVTVAPDLISERQSPPTEPWTPFPTSKQ